MTVTQIKRFLSPPVFDGDEDKTRRANLLSIARRIVEKLGGQVGVDSQPGQGSTFYFTLPAVDALIDAPKP
jgi:light-regulated signal transduction histidine kinase (bacteriophytochrome)